LRNSEEAIVAVLREAVLAGLIYDLDGAYAFTHDRVQEAAYALIPEQSRPAHHLRIGRSIIGKMSDEEVEEKIFDIVNQLNSGRELIFNPDEKELVAGLNLRAGRKAKASAAYDSACIYLSAGMELAGSEAWERRPELAFALWLERAESEYLNGNFDESEGLIAELLERARSKVEKVAAYRLRILLHLMKAEFQQAVDRGLECLNLFGIEMPAHPTRQQVQVEYQKIWENLGPRSIESLIDLPLMADPEIQAAMGILSLIPAPAFNTDINLLYLVFCQIVNTSLTHGSTGASAHGYAELATILGPVFHRYFDGLRFGRLACGLIEKYDFEAYKAKVYFCMQRAMLWKEPIASAIDFIRLAIKAGIETHDVLYACFSYGHLVTALLLQGVPLEKVWHESQKALDFIRKVRFQDFSGILLCQQAFVLAMRGEEAGFSRPGDTRFSEENFEARLTAEPMPHFACHYWILKSHTRFLLGDYQAATMAGNQAKPLLRLSEQHIQSVDYYFYSALSAAALCRTSDSPPAPETLGVLRQSLTWLQEWADSCPETFLDTYKMVLAELARLEGRDLESMRAADVIGRIRALFKKADNAKEPLDLSETIREVIDLIRSEMEKKKVLLRLELTRELPLLLGDRVQLQQVMLNLVLNAIEAMSKVEGRRRELVISTEVFGEVGVLVRVQDTGEGIDPQIVDRIFNAFHTTKAGGLGMGLSISRSIVENHYGQLWATSNEGPGTTFQFTLLNHPPSEGSYLRQ
jgi:hypothetical protein